MRKVSGGPHYGVVAIEARAVRHEASFFSTLTSPRMLRAGVSLSVRKGSGGPNGGVAVVKTRTVRYEASCLL